MFLEWNKLNSSYYNTYNLRQWYSSLYYKTITPKHFHFFAGYSSDEVHFCFEYMSSSNLLCILWRQMTETRHDRALKVQQFFPKLDRQICFASIQ